MGFDKFPQDGDLPLDRTVGDETGRKLGWFVSGLVLPCFRLDYYRQAAAKRVMWAALFLVLFGLLSSCGTAIQTRVSLSQAESGVKDAFYQDIVPTITMENGAASVDGSQPYVYDDEDGTVFIIDTTGGTTSIDKSRYDRGILLGPDFFGVLDDGQYQQIRLADLQELFLDDPFVLSAETAAGYFRTLSLWLTVVIFIFLVFWNTLVRLIFLASLALIVWGAASLFQKGLDYGPVLITGIYALVPATYLTQLLRLIGMSHLLLKTVILVTAWMTVLYLMNKGKPSTAARPEDWPPPAKPE